MTQLTSRAVDSFMRGIDKKEHVFYGVRTRPVPRVPHPERNRAETPITSEPLDPVPQRLDPFCGG